MRKMICCLLFVVGCQSKVDTKVEMQNVPSFVLCWSEYPSWSAYDVASEKGLINGEQGKLGPIEKKWGVDIVLKFGDYDTCLTLYGNKIVDAACLTQLDSLASSIGRPGVVVLPTSTSVGADACVVVGDIDLESLQGKETRGLEKSVSQYAFERNLTLKGKSPDKYTFLNMDPAAAAQAMQTNQKNIESIMVWNPFLLQTLRTRKDAKVVFDSATIPEEIIDCVVIGKDSLEKPKGKEFACAIVDTFYELNKLLADPQQKDETLVAIGAKFSSLGLEDMKLVVEQTRFYGTPEKALALLNSDKFRNETMPTVVSFCVSHEIVPADNSGAARIGFNDPNALLNFSTEFIEKVAKAK